MKKVKFINLCIVGLFALCMMACSSLEGDAKKMAKLMCEAEKNASPDKAVKAAKFAEKCEKRYSEKQREFGDAVQKEFENCK